MTQRHFLQPGLSLSLLETDRGKDRRPSWKGHVGCWIVEPGQCGHCCRPPFSVAVGNLGLAYCVLKTTSQGGLSSLQRKAKLTASSCIFWYVGHGPTVGSILSPNTHSPPHTHTLTSIPAVTATDFTVCDCPLSVQAGSRPPRDGGKGSVPPLQSCLWECSGTQGEDQWGEEGAMGLPGKGRDRKRSEQARGERAGERYFCRDVTVGGGRQALFTGAAQSSS